MWRPPARCAPLTCTSACCAGSSSTIGSGSAASPRPSAAKPRSTAAIATANGILSRKASSGTTRLSVRERALQAPLRFGERLLEVAQLFTEAEANVVRQPEVVSRDEQHAVLGPHPLHQVEGADRLAVAYETDRSRLRRMPAEGVAEALQPRLEHRIVGAEDRPGALPHPLAPPPPQHTPPPRERARGDDPTDPEAGQPVGLGKAVDDDHPLVAAPEGGGRRAVPLRALIHSAGGQDRKSTRLNPSH